MGLLGKAMLKGSMGLHTPQKNAGGSVKSPESGEASAGRKYPVSGGLPGKRVSLSGVLKDYLRDGHRYQVLVLDLPRDAVDSKSLRAFYSRLSGMVGPVGMAFRLPSKRCIVLSSVPLDRELVGHRLANSLHTVVLDNFEINTPDQLVKLISPYLL
jgi:hypothetical protein